MKVNAVFRVLTCCIVAVLMIEVCARLDDYVTFGAPLLAAYNSETLYQMDAIGKHGKPNARYKKWQLNSLGYRGPEPQPGKTTIVCFGSSETFGLYETPGEEYPRQLEREIRREAGSNNVQVINAAYPGETILTATRRIAEIVEAVHPKYGFIYPSPATYIDIQLQGTKPQAIAQPRFALRMAENVRNILKKLIPDSVQNGLRQRQIREAAVEFTLDRLPEANIEMFQHDLAALVEELRAHRVEPILVTHATYFGKAALDGDEPMLVAWRKFYPTLKEEGFLDMEMRANTAMKKLAAEQQITLVDAAAEIPPGNEYFADFVHFTDKGSHTMAVELAKGLRQIMAEPSY